MNNIFDVAAGTIVGTSHLKTGQVVVGKPNQDAFCVKSFDDITVGVICDGCGSGKFSHVGSSTFANIIPDIINHEILRYGFNYPDLMLHVEAEIAASLKTFASLFHDDRRLVINNYLLFTILVFIINHTTGDFEVYIYGDGVYVDKSSYMTIDSGDNNAPAYIALRLVDSDIDLSKLQFKLLTSSNLNNIDAFIIGSDGLTEVINAKGMLLPNNKKVVPDIQDFMIKDCYFENPDAINRFLRLANSDRSRLIDGKLVCSLGLFHDDVTLISVRRK